ncbi:MAG: TonB-dependent receptor [Acidobacteriota bacterium]|nr:TonB-dependent receptor [Acidobacteriota bacterium]
MSLLRRIAAVSLFVLFVLPSLFAQGTTGSLTGTVTSTDGSPLPGVNVTVSSPSLLGTRSVVTEATGNYSFPSLPPGNYNVAFELEGMQRVDRKVTVSLSQTSRADVSLAMSSLSESLTVTASAPAAVETTELATNFVTEQINALPTGRTIDDITRLAAGVNEAGPNNQITISGANSYDNLFLVDGVIVNENLRGQPNPLYIEDAIQETTVLSGGVSAEFGRFTGGVVSTITKSGGNSFSGTLRDSLTNPSWTEKSDFAAQVDPIDDINSSYEGTLGGRIIRDRLWFFAAGRYNESSLSRQTTLTNIPYTFVSEDKRFEGKLTGQITQNHSMIATYIDSKEHRDNNVSGGSIVDLRSLAPYNRPKSLLSLNYNGILSDKLVLEAQFSRMNDKFTNGAETRDLINGTLLIDDDARVRGWSPTFCGSPCPAKKRNNKSWLGKGSYFLGTRALGTHAFVGGLEDFRQLRNENNYQSGSDFRIHGNFIFVNGQQFFSVDPDSSQIEWDPVPNLSQTSDFGVRSLFLNDRWDLNTHWNFNVGVRYDKATGQDQAGNKTVDDSAFSPRLAANYDIGGNGHHRFSATYGKYVSKVDQGPADNTSTAGRYASYYFNYGGPAINPPGTPTSQLVPIPQMIQQVFAWFTAAGGTSNTSLLADSPNIPGTTLRFDRSLQAPSMDEFTLGYAMQLGNNGFVRVDAIHRDWTDFYVVRRSIATGKAKSPSGDTFDQGVIENSGDGLERKYRGFQLQGSYRFLKALTFGGNYTYGKLRGNVEGESASFATTFTDYHNYPEYTDFAQNKPVGFLSADMRHRANLWLAYDLNMGFGRLNLSLLERYHSALPYSAVATIDVRAGAANGPANGIVNPGYQTPPSSVTYFFSDRGGFRVDDITSTDLGINFYLPAIRGAQFFVEGDVLNLFNEQGIEDPDFVNSTILTRRNNSSTARCLQTNSTTRCVAFNPFTETPKEGLHWQKGPIFGQPTSDRAYQTPRTYRVSFGFRF